MNRFMLGIMTALLCLPALAKGAGTPESPWVIGYSQCNLGEPWLVQMNADVKKAADADNRVQVIYKDAQNDTLRQRSHIEEYVSQGVDAIIISPKEVSLREPIAKAYKAGIPVIILDRAVEGEDFTQFIGADNRIIGEAAGRWIAKKLGGKGNVVELKGLQTTIPGQDRNSGFRKGIEGSGIKIVFEADMKWLEPNARKEMESALSRFDDIQLVYAHNDPGAHGAWLAAKAAGREKDIIFVGIDALPQEGQQYVKQGVLGASFEYPTGGREAIQNAAKILGGEQLPKNVVLPSKYFTPENLAEGGATLNSPEDAAK